MDDYRTPALAVRSPIAANDFSNPWCTLEGPTSGGPSLVGDIRNFGAVLTFLCLSSKGISSRLVIGTRNGRINWRNIVMELTTYLFCHCSDFPQRTLSMLVKCFFRSLCMVSHRFWTDNCPKSHRAWRLVNGP